MTVAPADTLGAISRFQCCKNPDIERFLKNSAVDFERRGLCTSYIYLDDETFDVLGYFSLTHKALSIQGYSKSVKQRIAGKVTAEVAPFILLGQLGKRKELGHDGKVLSAPISGREMMQDVFSIIAAANGYIINRRVLVECDDDEKLLSFYRQFHFRILEQNEGKCVLYLKLEPPGIVE